MGLYCKGLRVELNGPHVDRLVDQLREKPSDVLPCSERVQGSRSRFQYYGPISIEQAQSDPDRLVGRNQRSTENGRAALVSTPGTLEDISVRSLA